MKAKTKNLIILGILVFIGLSTLLLYSFKQDLAENAIPCGDLLSTYAEKPSNLEFVKCERLSNNQTVAKASYRVSGEQSQLVEDFLVKRYGMKALRWVCCGWETMGGHGSLKHKALAAIDPHLIASVNMYASGEVEDEDYPNNVRMEFDRDKIEYFTVVVELEIV